MIVENATQIKSGITIDFKVSPKIRENIMCIKKCHICNTSTYTCESGKYLGSIIDDSVIMFDEIIEVTKTSNIF